MPRERTAVAIRTLCAYRSVSDRLKIR